MFNLKKSISVLILILGICIFFAASANADTGNPDLTVTGIKFTAAGCQSGVNGQPGQEGTLSVTVENLGGALTSSSGLLNWYNNFSDRGFVFMDPTPGILNFQLSRALPTADSPLGTDESISFTWVGEFNTAGDKNLQFTVNNANELTEAKGNENNNTLSQLVIIGDCNASVSTQPSLMVTNFKYSTQQNNDQNIDTQIEFDLTNSGTSAASFYLASWDNTTNHPLESTAGQTTQYNLAAGQTVHVYLINVNNIRYLADGFNSITIKEVSLDSQTVYNSQDFSVTRTRPTDTNIQITTPVAISNPSVDTLIPSTNTFTDQANSLNSDHLNQLLAEINSLRDAIAEQANQIKYLQGLIQGTDISTSSVNTLNNFITYGSDSNTKQLGAGERAAVIYSYKDAFGKLPTTTADLTDVVKIASGRWPSATSTAAETQAEASFQKVYQRPADMTDANDNAAVTIMAYGLRQLAVNRNLTSETAGIKTFQAIYGHVPATTEEWNIMQAITYSGATRGNDMSGR